MRPYYVKDGVLYCHHLLHPRWVRQAMKEHTGQFHKTAWDYPALHTNSIEMGKREQKILNGGDENGKSKHSRV